MLSLHNLIKVLETKISLLLCKSNINNTNSYHQETDYGKYETDSMMILNNVEEIAKDGNLKNALQDTQVFLKQAMDTLKNSSMRMKGFIEPSYEADQESHIISQPGIFRTVDNDIHHKHSDRSFENNRATKSFDNNISKRRKSAERRPDKSNSKSPRIYTNAKNVHNDYKIQAERISARDQNKDSRDNFTKVDNNYYTHRDSSPIFNQGIL
jgi:hypothetical protein